MERIEKTLEIGVPVRTAYNQWTQFEDFPNFMEGMIEVRQVDDTHLHWRASIAGREKEWDAEITEQVPDEVIAWRGTSGAPNAGEVRFQPIGTDRTRVSLALEYEPQTPAEKAADLLGVVSRKIDRAIEDFRAFIEKRGQETGGWRGEVHGGQKAGPGDIRSPDTESGTAPSDAPGTPGISGTGLRGRRTIR